MRGAKRNRIDRHRGEIERLVTRTFMLLYLMGGVRYDNNRVVITLITHDIPWGPPHARWGCIVRARGEPNKNVITPIAALLNRLGLRTRCARRALRRRARGP